MNARSVCTAVNLLYLSSPQFLLFPYLHTRTHRHKQASKQSRDTRGGGGRWESKKENSWAHEEKMMSSLFELSEVGVVDGRTAVGNNSQHLLTNWDELVDANLASAMAFLAVDEYCATDTICWEKPTRALDLIRFQQLESRTSVITCWEVIDKRPLVYKSRRGSSSTSQ